MSNVRLLIWHFYKPLLVANLLFTAVGIFDIYKIGFWFIGNAIFIKLVGYAVIVAYKYYLSNKTNLYFMNAGYGVKKMFLYAFGLDFIFFLLLASFVYLIK